MSEKTEINKRPIFHHDGNITYWSPRYKRWYHRIHPDRIPRAIAEQFERVDFLKWRKLSSFQRLKALGLF